MDSSQRLSPQRREADPGEAVEEEVAVHEVLLAAVDLDAAEVHGAAALEEVAVDGDAGDHVVQADARRAAVRAAADVAPAVPADHDAAVERIAEHVDARPGRRTPGRRGGSGSAR